MQRRKTPPIRNKLDLTDKSQVRLLKKRLRLSEAAILRASAAGASASSIVLSPTRHLPLRASASAAAWRRVAARSRSNA